MNIFEDLIDELKEENLLEETVIVTKNGSKNSKLEECSLLKIQSPAKPTLLTDNEFEAQETPQNFLGNGSAHQENEEDFAEGNFLEANLNSQPEAVHQTYDQVENQPPTSEKEFYRKRAMEEVTGLQMVEHVISGVEREQMKAVPKPYDDLSAKKSLHAFMQVSGDVKSPEHAQAEFALMQETESWCSALSHRDKRISVAHLRRYCETTKPPLSSQAIISLARFYRNSPFSESVRSKFDLVITRLFTKDIGGDKRIIVFTRDEVMGHLKELYAEWSSIRLYSENEDDSEIVLAAMKFEEFMSEAESANTFDELVKNDFFNRLRLFKESNSELFYAPLVTATAIECNIRIGNKYVDLIDEEREKANSENLQDKYGFLHDQAISDATSKTLQLVELLKERVEEVDGDEETENVEPQRIRFTESEGNRDQSKEKPKKQTSIGNGLFAVNKYLLAATVIIALISIGIYFGVNFYAPSQGVSANVKNVDLENSSLREFVESARISGETFYGITTPAWEIMSGEEKEKNLSKTLSIGNEKGFKKVHLVNKDGKTVGTAGEDKIVVTTP